MSKVYSSIENGLRKNLDGLTVKLHMRSEKAEKLLDSVVETGVGQDIPLSPTSSIQRRGTFAFFVKGALDQIIAEFE